VEGGRGRPGPPILGSAPASMGALSA